MQQLCAKGKLDGHPDIIPLGDACSAVALALIRPLIRPEAG